jgi:hypothetical protein
VRLPTITLSLSLLVTVNHFAASCQYHGSVLGNEVYAQQVSDAILVVIQAAQTGEPLAE